MPKPIFPPASPRPPDPQGSGGGSKRNEAGCAAEPHTEATDALWQYLRRIESGLDQIDARIDRLYIALGGGTILLAAIA